MIRTAVLAMLALVALASNADARPRHHPRHHHKTWDQLKPIPDGARIVIKMRRESSVVEHPAGCPSSAFCGCGVAVHIFGRPMRELWLAANWFKFPRAAPAVGMVAVRRHHVFALEQHIDGDTWLAFDPNSGGHRTRLHPRSIAGYVIVNPRAGVS